MIDGNVRLNQQRKPGLGLSLFDELGELVPIVGVAKNPFHGLDQVLVKRGDSNKPLYVTAAGIDEHIAAKKVSQMAGEFRIPSLLRRVDQLARG